MRFQRSDPPGETHEFRTYTAAHWALRTGTAEYRRVSLHRCVSPQLLLTQKASFLLLCVTSCARATQGKHGLYVERRTNYFRREGHVTLPFERNSEKRPRRLSTNLKPTVPMPGSLHDARPKRIDHLFHHALGSTLLPDMPHRKATSPPDDPNRRKNQSQ